MVESQTGLPLPYTEWRALKIRSFGDWESKIRKLPARRSGCSGGGGRAGGTGGVRGCDGGRVNRAAEGRAPVDGGEPGGAVHLHAALRAARKLVLVIEIDG